MTELERWKKAVVHLEMAADSASPTEIMERLRRDDITSLLERSRDLRWQGTGIFLGEGDDRFLATARHVVWNAELAARDRPSRPDDWIFSLIFRVPGLTDIGAGADAPLMNLGAGGPPHTAYLYARAGLDLAVIDLGQRQMGKRFADMLEERGHEPVPLSYLGQRPHAEGQEVFTVGYPGATAVLGEQPLTRGQTLWMSPTVSAPVFSFGRVAQMVDGWPTFLADMTIYPGNSGGPVVANDRLVGIVSQQPSIAIEASGPSAARVRVPTTVAVEVTGLPEMLDDLRHRRHL